MMTLVYQMGKVGSATIHHALLRAGVDVMHIHAINPSRVMGVAGGHAVGSKEFDRALGLDLLFKCGEPLDVITTVRDPIARNVSLLFESYSGYTGGRPVDDASPGELQGIFNECVPHHEPLTWFDDEFLPTTGIDVYAHEFDAVRGWSVMTRGNLRVLLLKIETSDSAIAAAVSAFVGKRVRINRYANVNRGKKYASFKESVRIHPKLLSTMLWSRYTRHFYTGQGIAMMLGRWCGR